MASVIEAGPDAVAAVIEKPTSYVDWGGVFAGVIVALAMSWLLLTFGSAIGLISISPYTLTSTTGTTLTIAAAVWFALTQIYALGVGAYIAARLRPRAEGPGGDELTFRDGVSGLSVWALSIVLGLFIAGVATLSATRTGAEAASAAATAAAPKAVNPDYLVDVLFRPANAGVAQTQSDQAAQPPAQSAQNDTSPATANPSTAAPEQTAAPASPPAGASVATVDEDTRGIVNRIIARSLAARQPAAERQDLSRASSFQLGPGSISSRRSSGSNRPSTRRNKPRSRPPILRERRRLLSASGSRSSCWPRAWPAGGRALSADIIATRGLGTSSLISDQPKS